MTTWYCDFLFLLRSGNCFIKSPFFYPFAHRRFVYSYESSPFRKAFCLPIKCVVPATRPISHLYINSNPSAIGWLVVPCGVYSVNRVFFGRSKTNIVDEVCKVKPSVTDIYSSTSIMCKSYMVWVCAALNHSRPNLIFRKFTSTVFSVVNAGKFFLKAPATSSVSGRKSVRNKLYRFSALAIAYPFCSRFGRFVKTNYSKFSKNTSDKVWAFHKVYSVINDHIIHCFGVRA